MDSQIFSKRKFYDDTYGMKVGLCYSKELVYQFIGKICCRNVLVFLFVKKMSILKMITEELGISIYS